MALRRNELDIQHSDLILDLDRLHVMVVAPLGALPEPRFRAVLERELRDLAASLEQHFSYEEEGGFEKSAERQILALTEQHRGILARIETLVASVPTRPLEKLAADVTELLDAIEQHESIEAKLFHR